METPPNLVAYLSKDDLDFQGGQAGGEDFHIPLASEQRATRTVQDLFEIVRGLIERAEREITGYHIRHGPRDWEGGSPPPKPIEEALAEPAARWNEQTAVSIIDAKPSQLALADARTDYHATGDPSELIDMGMLPAAERE